MFRKVAKISDIEEGKIKSFETRYATIAITRFQNKILAFEDVCSHDGEAISNGMLDGCIVTCPRHFAKFDLKSGKPLCMPATESISVYPVRVSGDDIEVDLED